VAKERAAKGNAGKRSTANSSTSSRTYKTPDMPILPEGSTDTEPSAHDSNMTALASGVDSVTTGAGSSRVYGSNRNPWVDAFRCSDDGEMQELY